MGVLSVCGWKLCPFPRVCTFPVIDIGGISHPSLGVCAQEAPEDPSVLGPGVWTPSSQGCFKPNYATERLRCINRNLAGLRRNISSCQEGNEQRFQTSDRPSHIRLPLLRKREDTYCKWAAKVSHFYCALQ